MHCERWRKGCERSRHLGYEEAEGRKHKRRRIAWVRVSVEKAGVVHLETRETACSEQRALTQSVLLRTAVQRTVSSAVVALLVSSEGFSTKRFRCCTKTRSGKYGRSICWREVAVIDGCTRMAMSCVCAVSSLFCFKKKHQESEISKEKEAKCFHNKQARNKQSKPWRCLKCCREC